MNPTKHLQNRLKPSTIIFTLLIGGFLTVGSFLLEPQVSLGEVISDQPALEQNRIAPSQVTTYGRVNSPSGLKVLSGPSLDSTIHLTLNDGAQVQIIDISEDNEWYRICCIEDVDNTPIDTGNDVLWIQAEFVTILPVVYDCNQVSDISRNECRVLVALYNDLGGFNWINRNNWLISNTSCNWFGVICDFASGDSPFSQTVVGIELPINNLKGQMLGGFLGVPNLRTLILYGNQITGAIPSNFNALPSLIELRLNQNQLTGNIPDTLGDLPNLNELRLGDNQLTGTIPATLGNLNNLTGLALNDNQLTGKIPSELGNLEKLTFIALQNNQLTDTIPAELGKLSAITSLRLDRNQLSGEIPAALADLNNVDTLDLSTNELSGQIPEELGSLSALQELHLYNNQLSGEIPDSLANLDLLREFSLANNRLSGKIPDGIFGLTNLTRIQLWDNQLEGTLPETISQLTQLQELSVQGNQLTGPMPNAIGELTQLHTLRLANNQFHGYLPAALVNLAILGEFTYGYNRLSLKSTDHSLNEFLQERTFADDLATQTIPPTTVQVRPLDSNTLDIRWTPVSYTQDGGHYKIYLSTDLADGYGLAGETATIMDDAYVVEGLRPNTHYYVSVRAYTPPHGNQQNDLESTAPPSTITVCTQADSADNSCIPANNATIYRLPAVTTPGIVCDDCIEAFFGTRAWWPLDETVIIQAERRFENVIKKDENFGTPMGEPTIAEGMVAQAVVLNGIDQYIEVADHAQIEMSEHDFSVSAWVRTSLNDVKQTILDKRGFSDFDNSVTETGYAVFLRIDGAPTLRLADGASNRGNFSSGISVNDGEWHLVTVTVDRNNPAGGRWHIDGILRSTFNPTQMQDSLNNAGNLTIGRNAINDNEFFTGSLDEVEVYERALTPDEITRMYAVGSTGKCKPIHDCHLAWGVAATSLAVTPQEVLEGTSIEATLENGDRLAALHPIASTYFYTLYYSNAQPTETYLDAQTVISAGLQQIEIPIQTNNTDLVSTDSVHIQNYQQHRAGNQPIFTSHPLMLLNLDVSLEWDAGNDTVYLGQLTESLRRTSDMIYDWTNGQAALGHIRVYQDREQWSEADIRIYATNRLRPNADIGGIVSRIMNDPTFTDRVENGQVGLVYKPGQIRMGPNWRRNGDRINIPKDWAAALGHEIGHYIFFLDENYKGIEGTPPDDIRIFELADDVCPGAMHNPYSDDMHEFHPTLDWLPDCALTFSHVHNGRADWETIHTFYPFISQPTTSFANINPGPKGLALPLTNVQIMPPSNLNNPTLTNQRVTINYRADGIQLYEPGDSTQAVLFEQNRVIDIGVPVQNGRTVEIHARGIRIGQRICIIDLNQSVKMCEDVDPDDLTLTPIQINNWQPELVPVPLTERSIEIEVYNLDQTLLENETLYAQLYPEDGDAGEAVALAYDRVNGHYAATLIAAASTIAGHVHVWVDEPEPTREAIVAYSWRTGAEGFVSGSGGGYAPVISGDGQAVLHGDILTESDQIYAIQTTNVLPADPPGLTVGQAYRLVASPNAPPVVDKPLELQYLGDRVTHDVQESSMQVYYWDDLKETWAALPTVLDLEQNNATTILPGEGIFVLVVPEVTEMYLPIVEQ
ncbi:MAG: LamG-like jellyroll fold domain-containing protein [Chloroflexota bacterium]